MWNTHTSKGLLQLLEQIIPRKIKSALHKGDKYICPFCNFKSKDLALIGRNVPILQDKEIIGAGKRLGGCYNCGATDRERLVYLFLIKEMDIYKNYNNILHIAPEKNISKKLLNHNFKQYICGDLFANFYRYPKYVQKINLLNIPFEEETFDLIICNHVLEHISDEYSALTEIKRVLKTNGKAILQVPISKNTFKTYENELIKTPKEREKHFGQFDHVRIYGQDYLERLANIGFQVDRINISSKYKSFGLNMEEDVFLVTKITQK